MSISLFQICSLLSDFIEIDLSDYLSIVNCAFLMEFTLFGIILCHIHKILWETFNFLKNILVKYVRKKCLKFHFSNVSIPSEWAMNIFLFLFFVWHIVMMALLISHMTLQIIWIMLNVNKTLNLKFIPNFLFWANGGKSYRSQ